MLKPCIQVVPFMLKPCIQVVPFMLKPCIQVVPFMLKPCIHVQRTIYVLILTNINFLSFNFRFVNNIKCFILNSHFFIFLLFVASRICNITSVFCPIYFHNKLCLCFMIAIYRLLIRNIFILPIFFSFLLFVRLLFIISKKKSCYVL